MPLIRIICDGAGKHGFGNLRRSATLSAAFKQKGYDVRLEALSGEAQRLLPASLADSGEADLWLLDLPYDGDEWVANARRQRRPVAALDYEGKLAPDLIISIFNPGGAPSGAHHLVGLEYAIIRPEISRLAPVPSGSGVIVVIGGGDQDGLGEKAALRLNALGAQVTLVDGPLATRNGVLPPEIIRLNCPSDLPARMASSAWGVTSGGGTMLEMLCLGKPIHVLPRTPREEALARLVDEKGALLGVGLDTLRLPARELRARVSARARELVDGNGIERIVAAVQTLL